MGTLLKLIAIFVKKQFLTSSGSLLLYLGTITAWIAIYTGDLADGRVSRSICDPTVLKSHENMAYYLAYIFSVASILDLSIISDKLPGFKKIWTAVVVTLMLIGSGMLTYMGDLGASLVYQQAAGVSVPPADCKGFE
ncbi:membrane protein, putative [Fulvivirga imtechensis AK7]|uniref:Membrane protein, putative n=1 Tax=Fulvivirga imtechensis AK7 TaxID=1237149 RepID=L8JNE4_9BACT|nr:membrane protein, putative [Fulvivirga imtechensis AK7]